MPLRHPRRWRSGIRTWLKITTSAPRHTRPPALPAPNPPIPAHPRTAPHPQPPPPPALTRPAAAAAAAAAAALIMHWVIMIIACSAILKLCYPWAAAGVRDHHRHAAHAALAAAVSCVLALLPPALLAALGAPVAAGAYFAAWAFIWLGMAAFGLIFLTLLMLLGPAAGAGAHSLVVLVNFICSPGMAPAEIVYAPMRLGMALPLWKCVAPPPPPPPAPP